MSAATPTTVRADGLTFRQVPRFRVLDILTLAFHRPDLVNIEPNSDAIEREIMSGSTGIKGLAFWMETVEGVKS